MVLARIEPVAEARRSPRKRLRLSTSARLGPTEHSANIHDLSETGLLMETSEAIQLGEELIVDLPNSAGTLARVIWNSRSFYGCQFVEHLPRATLSAAWLKSEEAPDEAEAAGDDDRLFSWVRSGLLAVILLAGLFVAAILVTGRSQPNEPMVVTCRFGDLTLRLFT